jgi:hypothetical protein
MYIKNGSFKKHTYIISYVPPIILSQPIGGTVQIYDPFNFRVKVRGSAPIEYQWYKNNKKIIGAQSDTLNIPSCVQLDDAIYYCKITNNRNVIYTNTVKLNVLAPPLIIEDPISLSAIPLQNISFSVSAIGSEPLTYNWYKDNNNVFSTTNTLFLNNVQKSDEGNYYVVVSNYLGNVTSLTASLLVYDKLVIYTQPTDLVLNSGETSAFNLSCFGTTPISAQWRKDGTNYGSTIITNLYNIDLNVNNVTFEDEGYYDCVLTNIVGSVTSNQARLFINKPLGFTINPLSELKEVGDTVTFTVEVTGTTPINYEWFENGSVVSNSNKHTYTLSDIQLEDSGDYHCVATNIIGSVTSTTATLSISSNYMKTTNDEYITFNNNTYWKYN